MPLPPVLFWPRPDLLRQLAPGTVDLPGVERLRAQRREQLSRPNHARQAATLVQLPSAEELPQPMARDLDSEYVTIGSDRDLTVVQHERIQAALLALKPWRKGPFRLFGHSIDAEWRSNLKWDRIRTAIGDLRGRRILDVGCGNGYYMFRAAADDPAAVVGIDPSIPFLLTFELMQRFLRLGNLQYELLGVENMELFDQAFDVALCMGILYHHRGPILILKRLLRTLRVGGHAIIESQSIPGDGSLALFPQDRYAKARNVYFVPTRDCLINWAVRAGFRNVELVSHAPVTTDEQAATPWMTFESLPDFLDPKDPSRTVEGYPAPWRTVVRGERKFV